MNFTLDYMNPLNFLDGNLVTNCWADGDTDYFGIDKKSLLELKEVILEEKRAEKEYYEKYSYLMNNNWIKKTKYDTPGYEEYQKELNKWCKTSIEYIRLEEQYRTQQNYYWAKKVN